MATPGRASILASLQTASRRLASAQADWVTHMAKLAAESGQTAALKLSSKSSIYATINNLGVRTASIRRRQAKLRPYGRGGSDIELGEILQIVDASEPFISTETATWRANRVIGKTEAALLRISQIFEVAEDAVLTSLTDWNRIMEEVIELETGPAVMELVTIVEMIEDCEKLCDRVRAKEGFAQNADFEKLEYEMENLRTLDVHAKLRDHDKAVFELLSLVSRASGIRLGRQRLITEFFEVK